MRIINKYKLVLLITIILFTFNCLNSQTISNIRALQGNNIVVIYYDLTHTRFYQDFNVFVYYSYDNGTTFTGPLKYVTGDAGSGIIPGKNKKIEWDLFAEGIMFKPTDRVIFKVDAERNVLLVKGSVPGAKNGLLLVRKSGWRK